MSESHSHLSPDRTLADVVADMESSIHDIRDLAGVIEHVSGSAVRGDIPAKVGLGLSAVADMISEKADRLKADWETVFRQVVGRSYDSAPSKSC